MRNSELIGNLLEPRYKKHNEEWNCYLNSLTDKILWYPSAGDDLRHFFHIQNNGINGLFTETPTVIHSDKENNINFKIELQMPDNFTINTDVIWRMPLQIRDFILPPPHAEYNEQDDLPLSPNTTKGGSSIPDLFNPKSQDEINKALKEKGITEEEAKKPDHKIELIYFKINTPEHGVLTRYVLYFFWDNIILFNFLIDNNIPVNCILSNRDTMDNALYLQFWQYFSNCQTIYHIICSEHIFGGMRNNNNEDVEDDNLTIIYHQDNTVLAQLYYFADYVWNDSDTLKIYQVVRQ